MEKDSALVIHWDGKGLTSSNNNPSKNIEQLSIYVASEGEKKLFGIPIIPIQ